MTRVQSFEALIKPCYRRLYAFALRISRDQALAEDLTQETLLAAFRAFDRFDQSKEPLPWLFTILRRRYINHRNSAPVRRETAQDLDDRTIGADQPGQLQAIERRELREKLEKCLGKLPEKLAEAVITVDIEGLDYAEASATLDVPIGTIRSRLSRARAALRACVLRSMEPKPRRSCTPDEGTS